MSAPCRAQLIYESKFASEPPTRVAELMFQYRTTIREMHDATGIAVGVLHGLRHGHHRMSADNAVKLAAFFGVTVDDVVRRW